MIGSSRNYAIGMAHFQLGGGWKTVLVVLAVYVVLFIGGASLFYYENYMAPGAPGAGIQAIRMARVVLALLLGLQGFALLFVGGARASNSVRLDLSSNMIESHRLMPISSSRAVWGYLLGPTAPTVLFVVLNLVLSFLFGMTVVSGSDLERMAISQGVVFAFAVFIWSLAVMGTFVYRQIFALIVAGVIMGLCVRAFAYAILPGLALLMTPFMGETIFNFGMPGPRQDLGYAVGIAGQAALFLIFFAASCRLYRGTYETAFNSGLGCLMLGVWAALSAVGIHVGPVDAPLGGNAIPVEKAVEIGATLAVSVALSVAALWPFVHEERVRPRAWVSALYVLLVTGIVCLPLAGLSGFREMEPARVVWTAVSLAAQVTVVYCMLRIMRQTKFILALFVAGGVTVFLWVGPLILEVVRLNFFATGPGPVRDMSILGNLSPIAMLSQLWSRPASEFPLQASLVWQWMVAGMAVGLVMYAARRRARRAVTAGFPEMAGQPVAAAVKVERPRFGSASHGIGSGEA